MTIALIVGQSAEVDLKQPAQQVEGGRFARARLAPGGHRVTITGETPGRETLRFALEDASEIAIEVVVG